MVKKATPAWGPKMAALPNDQWRAFVVCWLDGAPSRSGGKGYTEAARRAGWNQTDESLKVTAYRLAHDTRIQEAIQEEARKRLVDQLPLAIEATQQILEDKAHKDRANVVKTVLDRAGLHEIREEKHTVEFVANDPALLQRIKLLSERVGIPMEKLIGRTAAAQLEAPAVVEGEFEEVKEKK